MKVTIELQHIYYYFQTFKIFKVTFNLNDSDILKRFRKLRKVSFSVGYPGRWSPEAETGLVV
jgi:hypothetical protein